MSGIPIYFGEIALNEQYIDDKILQQSLILQKKNNKMLGEILMEKGLLQEKHVNRILKIQKNYKIKLEREYFSHMALKNGYLSNKDIRQLKYKLPKSQQYKTKILQPTDMQSKLLNMDF